MDRLSIDQRRVGDVIILDLAGKVTIGTTNRQLQDALRRLVAEGERSVVLDLSQVTYVDSTGLGEIVAGYSTLRRGGGRLALVNVSDRVMDLMTVTKLYTVFDIYTSEAEAVESFGGAETSVSGVPITNYATSRLS